MSLDCSMGQKQYPAPPGRACASLSGQEAAASYKD